MLKTLLLAGATLLAIPALAQTSGSSQSPTTQSGVPTTTNDHDPTETPADAGNPAGTSTFGSQVNGGVTSSSPGAGNLEGQADQNGQSDQSGQMGQTSEAGQINNGQQGMTATGSYQGTGGPAAGARDYPPCSRTVTDRCIQRERRR
ncbi:MAG TPA: hypothetical protein VGX37_07090 [Allosphingosinicella sp.]|jgi:hypothetical protein|nr:hypothetical protein [Allosphingosinicella sp.]